MRDFVLTFPSEADAIAALPELRVSDRWRPSVIPGCTRWSERPTVDPQTETATPGTVIPGWHCIVRASALAPAAQAYQVSEPTDIEPVPAGGLLAPTAPRLVSRFQARAALHLAGLLETVEAQMQHPAVDPIARLAWEEARDFHRDSPTVAAMSQALGLSEAQLDALFITAAGIEA